jgi:SAM-dependent methyltransferase
MADPNQATPGAPEGGFASAWDDYAARARPPQGKWVGDEWGDEQLWTAWFARLFTPHDVKKWKRAIEIGQGSGKYTRLVLAAGDATVLALDVSEKLLEVCAKRLAAEVAAGRLKLKQIGERDPDALARAAREAGFERDVDAVYSIDTLVHLTTTQLAALLLSATEVLRPGGCFIGTFANATSEAGLDKLVADVDRVVRGGGAPSTGCFHWSSPEVIRALAQRFGYSVVLCDLDPEHRRDGHFVLRLADPAKAAAARSHRADAK